VFAIFSENREIITIGPDTRLHVVYSKEEQLSLLYAGPWTLFSTMAPEEQDGEIGLAHQLLESIFIAIMEGRPGFDVNVFLGEQPA